MYYKELAPDSKEFIRTMEMVEKYLGELGELQCTKMMQLYNEKTLTEFYKKWSSSTSLPVEFDLSPRSVNNPKHLVKKSYSELLDRNNYNTGRIFDYAQSLSYYFPFLIY